MESIGSNEHCHIGDSRIVNLVEGVISAVISAERVKRDRTISRAMSSHAEERLRKMSQSIKRLCPVHDV